METFAGQWEHDTRQGYGVCERSDGVTYEGQWLRNQRHGYGQTKFQDGTCEQGRYHFGKLVFLSWPKGTKPHMLLYNYHIMREVATSVKRARMFALRARERAKEAMDRCVSEGIVVLSGILDSLDMETLIGWIVCIQNTTSLRSMGVYG